MDRSGHGSPISSAHTIWYVTVRALRRQRERGASAVEAAIIFPVLILLLFGIIEVTLLLRDYVSLGFLVREGARTGTQLARVDGFEDFVKQAMQESGNALPVDAYRELWIYKVDPNQPGTGLPVGASSFDSGQCVTDCFVYQPQTVIESGVEVVKFLPVSGIAWDFNTHIACPYDNDGDGLRETDTIGVLLRAEHQSIVGFVLPDTIEITDYAVGNFEPIVGYDDNCGFG